MFEVTTSTKTTRQGSKISTVNVHFTGYELINVHPTVDECYIDGGTTDLSESGYAKITLIYSGGERRFYHGTFDKASAIDAAVLGADEVWNFLFNFVTANTPLKNF